MPNKYFNGKTVLAGLLLVSSLAACNQNRTTSSLSNPSESKSSLTSTEPVPSSEPSSSAIARYALSVQYDQTLLSVVGTDGNPLANEYEEGATISFRVTILDATYGNLEVNVNGSPLEAVEGVYSFTMSRKTTIRLSVELMTVALGTDDSNLSLVFVDKDGKELEQQNGSFIKGSNVSFRLASQVPGYLTFHDFTLKDGDTLLTPKEGIYTVENLVKDTTLAVTMAEHQIGEDGKCSVCGQDEKAFSFAPRSNCTITYIEGKGWKIQAIDKTQGYEFIFNPTVFSHHYEKGETLASFVFGNGKSFGTLTEDGVEGNPVNCTFNVIGWNADLTANTKYFEGYFSGTNFIGGDDDKCGPKFNLESDKRDLRFYVNPTDNQGKVCATSYLYEASLTDPRPAKKDYFAMDDGGTCTYDESHGWKLDGGTGNHWKLSGLVTSYYQKAGKKKMRMTFGPAWDDALADAQTSRLIINVSQNGSGKQLLNSWISVAMTKVEGTDDHYYYDFDLSDSTIDWSWGVEFYDYGVSGKYIIYVYGVDFLD